MKLLLKVHSHDAKGGLFCISPEKMIWGVNFETILRSRFQEPADHELKDTAMTAIMGAGIGRSQRIQYIPIQSDFLEFR